MCGHESSREDTFLDLQLVIKGYGETKAVGSIEEALAKWSQIETLEGANQYHCDTCKKKVDAEKGLSLIGLPYILTLQLERFTWDFEKAEPSRVKLNDRVTFPLILDMNQYMGPPLRNSQIVPTVDIGEYSKFKIRKIDPDSTEGNEGKEEVSLDEDENAQEDQKNKEWNTQIEKLSKNGRTAILPKSCFLIYYFEKENMFMSFLQF